jgi:hypothetical protein
MRPIEAIQAIQEKAGWTNETLLSLIFDALAEDENAEKSVIDYLENVADDERNMG